MKKLIYTCCLVCTMTMSACNWYSDPLELVYPGTDLSGKKDDGGKTQTPDEKAISDFQSILATTDYAWKMTVQTSKELGAQYMTIYFVFDFENKQVKVISDQTLESKSVDISMAVNKDKKIVIDLSGTDLELLGDNALIVENAVEGSIKCTGITTGNTYELVNASEDEVNNLIPLSEKLQKSGLEAGLIVNEAGNTVAHYYMDVDNKNFYVTYWDDGYIKFASAPFTSGTNSVTTDVKFTEGKSGNTNFKNFELKSINLSSNKYKLEGIGLTNCALANNQVSGMDVCNFVVNGDNSDGGFHFTLHKNHDWGDNASESILNEMKAWGDLKSWEVACGSWSKGKGWAPGFCFSTNSVLSGWTQDYEYIVWGDYTKTGKPGRFFFTEKNPGVLAPSGPDAYNDVKKHLPKLLDFLFGKDGLFVVFEDKNKTGKNYSYIYLFDPIKKIYLKMGKDGRFGNGQY